MKFAMNVILYFPKFRIMKINNAINAIYNAMHAINNAILFDVSDEVCFECDRVGR